MATVQLPVRTDSNNYAFTVTLEGQAYEFTFRWNFREGCWEMSIADVVDGLAVRVAVDLLEFVPVEGKPPGSLLAIDTTDSGTDPGLAELGDRVLLTYVEST